MDYAGGKVELFIIDWIKHTGAKMSYQKFKK